MAVPGGPGHRFGDLGQAAEGLAIPSEALFQDHDPLELALPFTHEQRADLQTDPFSRLRRAPVERSADAILFPRAKDPSDRFVETAEGVRLEPTGQHPYQKPAWKMGRRFATQVGAPLTAQPIEIKAPRLATIDRTEASSGGEASALAPSVASPPAWSWRARGSCRLRRLCRLLLGPAAVQRVALEYSAISLVGRGPRDPVD